MAEGQKAGKAESRLSDPLGFRLSGLQARRVYEVDNPINPGEGGSMATLTLERPRAAHRKGAKHDRLRSAMKSAMQPLLLQYAQVLVSGTEALGTFVLDLSEMLPDLAKTREPKVEHYKALIRGAAARTGMLEAHGGSVSADQASTLLDVSKTRVLERYKEGTVLGVRIEKQNAVRFPVWQFLPGEPKVRPGVAETIAVFRETPGLDDWAIMTFFLAPRDSLGGKAPVDLLAAGHSKRVVNLARADVD